MTGLIHGRKRENGIRIVRPEEFDIGQIAASGQCFRMESLEEQRYAVHAGNRYLELEQNEKRLLFHCSAKEFQNFWRVYFDLDMDYGAVRRRVDGKDTYLKAAAEFGRGIRILRQDLWEMLITFLITQQNNIRRIRRIIGLLCTNYGEKRCCPDGSRRQFYYTFPGVEQLAAATEEELRACNLGYRARYVKRTSEQVAEGRIDLEAVRSMEYPDARRALMECCGVGEKVADCICLFGLHELRAFPVDTHIRKILEFRYPSGFPFERYQDIKGIIQQYLFYYDLLGTEEEKEKKE